MSTTKEYEECNIMFSTMNSIRIILKNKEKRDESKIERTFEIQCITDKYQVSNHSLRESHPGMFKEKYFYFFPTNDLVKSMPFDFVNGLKDGKWTKLENKWLNGVKKTLKQAVSNSIKDVKFVRKIMKDDLHFTESNLSNKDNDTPHFRRSLFAQCHMTSSGETPTPDLFVVLMFKVYRPLGVTASFETDTVFVDNPS